MTKIGWGSERDVFLEEVRVLLNGEIKTETIMTFSFEIV